MRRRHWILLALPLIASPHAAQARGPALEVPDAIRAGERVELRWDGLPPAAREVELELSLDGGRWIRISPEIAAEEGHFAWRAPELCSARARLRLRAGGDQFEVEIATSREFRIDAPGLDPGPRASAPEWWRVGERGAGRGWAWSAPAAMLSNEAAAAVAESETRVQGAVEFATGTPTALDPPLVAPGRAPVHATPSVPRRQPLRL
ncbi:MAG TPA: hypothetical protein VI504_02820 [Candidatus Eisenbacteria bacterium]